jgi:hypothetical protein
MIKAMDQPWFEMGDVRKRRLNDAVWIPLRSSEDTTLGKFGYIGYRSEFFVAGSIAVPLERRTEVEKLSWMDLDRSRDHKGVVQEGHYIPSDIFKESSIQAIELVLDQSGNTEETRVWHLHQDIVVTLRLKREGDIWLAMDEGYVEVARLRKSGDGTPILLEIRAEHLKDYLCARGMALYVSSYRSREEIVEDASHIGWSENPFCPIESTDRWEGRLVEIHEGGEPYGTSAQIVHLSRTAVDLEEDVPKIGPFDDNIALNSWTRGFEGKKLFRIWGELWRNEWVEPAIYSPRIRGDEVPPSTFFIVDASGKKEGWKTLRGGGRWLWFRPEVMTTLVNRRGGGLEWYTRDTGRVKCSPDYGVVFGVNKLGLVNVYAKDIAFLPDWQQQVWGGFNTGPEAGVSEELLASQAKGTPSKTQAPEKFIFKGIELLNKNAREKFGFTLFREHEHSSKLLAATHRFRSINKDGLLALAKDMARLVIDSINASELQKIVVPPAGEKWGSLKTLENLLKTKVGPLAAYSLLSPLHGIYNLRHADAHLPSKELDDAFELVQVDQTQPYVLQGRQLLEACVSALYAISKALGKLEANSTTTD